MEVSPTPAGIALEEERGKCAREASARFGKRLGRAMPKLTAQVFGAAAAMEGGEARR